MPSCPHGSIHAQTTKPNHPQSTKNGTLTQACNSCSFLYFFFSLWFLADLLLFLLGGFSVTSSTSDWFVTTSPWWLFVGFHVFPFLFFSSTFFISKFQHSPSRLPHIHFVWLASFSFAPLFRLFNTSRIPFSSKAPACIFTVSWSSISPTPPK